MWTPGANLPFPSATTVLFAALLFPSQVFTLSLAVTESDPALSHASGQAPSRNTRRYRSAMMDSLRSDSSTAPLSHTDRFQDGLGGGSGDTRSRWSKRSLDDKRSPASPSTRHASHDSSSNPSTPKMFTVRSARNVPVNRGGGLRGRCRRIDLYDCKNMWVNRQLRRVCRVPSTIPGVPRCLVTRSDYSG